MKDKNITQNDGSLVLNILSYAFGILAFAIGLINTFWGHPIGFGIFIILLSITFFLPVNSILKSVFGFIIPRIALLRVFLALFILWASLGVGELFNKLANMFQYFQSL